MLPARPLQGSEVFHEGNLVTAFVEQDLIEGAHRDEESAAVLQEPLGRNVAAPEELLVVEAGTLVRDAEDGAVDEMEYSTTTFRERKRGSVRRSWRSSK